MKLSRKNYEPFLIDYFDGILNPLQVAELLLFIEQNPDIKAEFEALSSLNGESRLADKFLNKEHLKRKVAPSLSGYSVQELMLRKIENEFTGDELHDFELFLTQNENFKKELLLFESAKIQPDLSLVFPNKNRLKKKRTLVLPLYTKIFTAAAVLLLLLALPFFISNLKQMSPKGYTYIEKKQAAFLEKVSVSEPSKLSEQLKLPQAYTPIKNQRKAEKEAAAQYPNFTAENSILVDSKDSLVKSPVFNSQTQGLPVNEFKEVQTELLASKDSIKAIDNKQSIATEAAKPYVSGADWLRKKINLLSKENLVEKNKHDTKKKEKISAWNVAALGAKLISKLSGKTIKLQNNYDSQGELRQFAIVSDEFEFSRSR